MAPLLPSESTAYSLTLPEPTDDERCNLNVRTGAASTYTRSAVVMHGGLVVGLGLPKVTIPQIEEELVGLGHKQWSTLLSNEMFYLNIINRKWNRLDLLPNQLKPAPRLYHSLAYFGNSVFLFGGLVLNHDGDKLIPSNEMWEFNIDNNEWICLDDGSSSGTVSRYGHTILAVNYISPVDKCSHPCVCVTGGRGELNQELVHVAIFDLTTKQYVNNTNMQLNLNELKTLRNHSTTSNVDPISTTKEEQVKMKVTREHSFVVAGSGNTESDDTSNNDVLFFYSQDSDNQELKNPVISLPVIPSASGLRMPLSSSSKNNTSVIPRDLIYPTGGIFGPNIIVSGTNSGLREYQVFLFNRPSQKWTRLSIDNKKRASELYLWKSFSWHSHHKVMVLGSAEFPKGAEFSTVQKFDLLVLVGLPITNIFHAFSVPQAVDDGKSFAPKFTSMKENTSFEAYSKYIAPTTKISSIRSVFPNYAVTLGRNAFERYGSSLADFEFITADGDKVNVPLMLLRKRWGRCFDMLLAKAYARAVYKLENTKDEESEDIQSMTSSAKKSLIVLNKASQQNERSASEAPQFRLPFQDKNPQSLSVPSSAPSNSGGPTSRKASVVSTGNASLTSTSTTDLPDAPDFDNLPPMTLPPNEPLPPVETRVPLKSIGSRDYLRDSPRGSISGASMSPNTAHQPQQTSNIKLKDLRSPVNNLKKRGTSRSSSVQQNDDNSVNDTLSQLDSIPGEGYEETKQLLEPLLIPRSLYLPFSTATVQAVAEFMFTGQLGDKWLLSPTTTDTFLIAKFYELPLLYDLISEALFAMIGKKEDSLMKGYGSLLNSYQTNLRSIFKNDDSKIEEFFNEHPNVKESFKEIESYLNTVDDGFLNIALLRKASKASTFSSGPSSKKNSVDLSRRRSSAKGRIGKSNLSKEVSINDEDDIDAEDEGERSDAMRQPIDSIARASTKDPIKFKTDSMSLSPKKQKNISDDDIDPITPLSKGRSKASFSEQQSSSEAKVPRSCKLDDDDPLSTSTAGKASGTDGEDSDQKKSSSESGQPNFQVPEGNFTLSKDKIQKVRSNDSLSSNSGSNKKETTSDSDDMAVGLGLVTNLKLKDRKKNKLLSNDELEQEDEINESSANLPILENLASPNSPAPEDHLIQIIYEVAALACDMKLLLRAINVLEMSKFFQAKHDELLSELDAYGLKYSEQQLQEELASKEKEEQDRLKNLENQQAKEIQKRYEEGRFSKEREEQGCLKQLEGSRTEELEKGSNGKVADISSRNEYPATAVSSTFPQVQLSIGSDSLSSEAENGIGFAPKRASNSTVAIEQLSSIDPSQAVGTEEDNRSSAKSLRSTFSSFRSLSNLNLTQGFRSRKSSSPGSATSPVNSDETNQPTRTSTLKSFRPFQRWNTGEQKKKILGFFPRRSYTSRQ